MKVPILRKDKEMSLPTYQTSGSVAFDFMAAHNKVVESHQVCLISTGLVICTPPGYSLILAARSSTPLKKGLMLANGIGIVDQDYCGPDDDVKILVYNFTEFSVEVKKGDRIAQGFFLPLPRISWEEIDSLSAPSRGGYGSTG